MKAKRAVCLLIFCLLLAAASPSSRAETLGREEMVDLFIKGKELFREANERVSTEPEEAKKLYLDAAMYFERIVDEGGIHNGRLYYNIGNAYFRIGDIGRAILYYRKAQLLTPNDPNLQQNLGFAIQKRADAIEEKQETKILKTLFFWHYDTSLKVRLLLFTVFFAALWTCASVRIFIKRPVLFWGQIISAVCGALLLGSILMGTVSDFRTDAGVILSKEVVARKGDGPSYQPSFKEPLHAGTEFRLLEDRSDWIHVELSDGRRCWIPRKSAGFVRL